MTTIEIPQPLGYRENGEPNSFHITHGNDWVAAILMNGKYLPAKQEAIMRLFTVAPELLDALQPFVAHNSSEEFIKIMVRTADVTRARDLIDKALGPDLDE